MSDGATLAGKGLPPVRGPWKMLWIRLRKNRIAFIGGTILLLLYFLACFGGYIAPYDFNVVNTNTSLYGPMLLGGYHLEQTASIEGRTDEGESVLLPSYRRIWRWFDGGVHFTDSDGNFTLRPHVYPLREALSYDEYGETEYLLTVDKSVSLPIEFFTTSEEDHELFSFCGFFPIRGHGNLMGVRPTPELAVAGGFECQLFLLGTDTLGRDLWTRILYGGQISLSVGLLGILISMSLGLVIGGIAGYYGGWWDFFLMRFVELLMAIPGLYLILTLRYAIPKGLTSRQTYMMIIGILALAGWASTARVVRGMVLSLKEQEFALAARALGSHDSRVILRHILPNTASFVIVTATLMVPYYILGEVALSFLGFGITEPDASWGLLLKDAQNSQILKYSPWLVIPGFFIFIAVLAYNFLGDGLRDAADPRAILGSNE
ncbi:MAG TPA: ABC transporter permease [Planctomycetes bacterium]|nr:ABC transporter permease [Planctomycetota bacterium]